jgi:hypothetical protein
MVVKVLLNQLVTSDPPKGRHLGLDVDEYQLWKRIKFDQPELISLIKRRGQREKKKETHRGCTEGEKEREIYRDMGTREK